MERMGDFSIREKEQLKHIYKELQTLKKCYISLMKFVEFNNQREAVKGLVSQAERSIFILSRIMRQSEIDVCTEIFDFNLPDDFYGGARFCRERCATILDNVMRLCGGIRQSNIEHQLTLVVVILTSQEVELQELYNF